MQSQLWQKAIQGSADPQRAEQYFEQFKAIADAAFLKKASAEHVHIIISVFSGSQTLSEQLLGNKECLSLLDPEKLKLPSQKQVLRRDVSNLLKPLMAARDYSGSFAQLRQFKQLEMLRIGGRDLARLSYLPDVVRDISNIADVSLEALLQICWQQFTDKFGIPYHRDAAERWQPTEFCVLGMGKLGGHELNYSSDVDVLFVYRDEGHVFKIAPRKNEPPGKGMANHQFFNRLSEAFIAEVGRMTSDGFLFRIDLRLRPEGVAGPLSRSLDSYENYYAQWGQTWERMMLIKTRCVAGDEELASEFLEMVQPFRYPRSLSERVLRDISAMKQRIENEVVKAGELERNVKLGHGGIREIEFVAQTQQLLHAGRTPFLQGAQTLPTLDKLVQYKLLAKRDAQSLTAAYIFLRDVEHRLQMESNQQTHTIPTERKARERLAKLMGFASLPEFEAAKKEHSNNVRAIYDKFLRSDESHGTSSLPSDFRDEPTWTKLLTGHAFRDPAKALRLIREFVEGPGFVHVSSRTSELARELLPKFFGLCPNSPFKPADSKYGDLSDPDRVLARLDSFITAYGTRAMLYDLWTSNPSLFQLLLLLFDRSEFLAEVAIRTPDLVDELELSGRLRRSKTAEETLRDLRYGLEDPDQKAWLRKYHQAEFMRIGLRDILGLADFEQNLFELSALADACLQYALEVVMRKNKVKAAPFAIIAMGKLGGNEITYGSDLDILFVADSKTKNLPALQKLAAEVMETLSQRTEHGATFETDARLRPDGAKGLLVNTLKAYEDYYRNRAQLWEIQSLTRIRPVAGNAAIGDAFKNLATELTNFQKPSRPLLSHTELWKQQIAKMRLRIEKERTPAGKDHLAIKTGSGGLIDAEFMAQTFCLEHGWLEPNTMRALMRAREDNVLNEKDSEQLISNYRELRRIEGILRRWSYEGETELPNDAEPLYRVAVRCGYKDAEAFMAAQERFRKAIREIYKKVLPS
ncbi:MAG: bifunctional [glutamate--ammonia ligase]-adenylyl-L-tyrosine phosphorylase/[glutamate--ammonia-ligase] adenylyltransferase [Verrucomicrobia bacterium]|nr:bifunctional [glutamate--ammonia ligase]-adenylyl-L-tyrosine phosphorylase/[glutamate--ammonia-ligase] adenylyltransferase [Verrucomicrobiota bacterium]